MADYSVTYDQLDALLQGLDPNTADTPYEIEITTATEEWLNGSNQAVQGTLQYVLKQNSSKYVSLTWGNSAKQVLSLFSDTTWMFWTCSSLVSIDASALSRVAYYTFGGCSSLVSVDITGVSLNWDIHGLFLDCRSLVSVAMTGNTNVTRTESMFYRCTSLQSVNVSGLDSVTNAKWMFSGCTALKEIHGWQIPLTASMGGCFEYCRSLEHIYTPETPPQKSSWRAWDIKKDTANSLSEVTIYGTSGNPVTVQVPSSGSYTLEASAKVDELLFSGTSAITQTHIDKMLATQIPITGNANALDPTQDNFVMLAKDRNAIKTNITTDVIEAGNKLPPTSEAVQAAIGGAIIPTGTILNYGGTVAPEGFVLCIGQTALREDYAGLISWAIRNNVIGENKLFGEGDGSTTFVFPDLRECVLVGAGENTTYVTGNSDVVIAAHDVYNVGEFKDDQLQGHEHNYMGHNAIWKRGMDNIVALIDETKKKTSGMVSDGTNGSPRTGSTTHGKQIGINYIIKF